MTNYEKLVSTSDINEIAQMITDCVRNKKDNLYDKHGNPQNEVVREWLYEESKKFEFQKYVIRYPGKPDMAFLVISKPNVEVMGIITEYMLSDVNLKKAYNFARKQCIGSDMLTVPTENEVQTVLKREFCYGAIKEGIYKI